MTKRTGRRACCASPTRKWCFPSWWEWLKSSDRNVRLMGAEKSVSADFPHNLVAAPALIDAIHQEEGKTTHQAGCGWRRSDRSQGYDAPRPRHERRSPRPGHSARRGKRAHAGIQARRPHQGPCAHRRQKSASGAGKDRAQPAMDWSGMYIPRGREDARRGRTKMSCFTRRYAPLFSSRPTTRNSEPDDDMLQHFD